MRKTIIFAIMLVLAFAVLAGCAADKKEPNNTPDPVNAGNKDNGAIVDKEEVPKDPVKFSISMRTLNVAYVENHPDINKDKYVLAMEEMANADVDIRLVPHNEYQEKMIQMFATNDIPDVVQGSGGINGPELAGAVENGIFLPLNDLLEEFGQDLLKNIPQIAWDRMTDSKTGNIYGIPETLSNPSRRATWIRTDLLEQLKMDVPTTVEETLEVLRGFKSLGLEHPFAGRTNFKYSDTFFGAYDVFGYLNQFKLFEDGLVKPSFFDVNAMKKAITTYQTMFNEGLIHGEFATVDSGAYRSNVTGGKAGMWSMNANEMPIWGAQLMENVPGATVALVPSPVGDDGSGGYAHYNPVTRSYYINAKSADKAADIVKFFNWMTTEEADLLFSYGIENEDYTIAANGDPVFEMPTDTEGTDRMRFLNGWLWMVQDTTYNQRVSGLTQIGRDMIDHFDNVLSKEGRRHIEFDPRLAAFVKYPDLTPKSDELPPLILEHVLKMVYGRESIDSYESVLDEYLSKGGNEVIEEATQRYNDKENSYN